MYDYVAVSGATANWLLAQASRRAALSSALAELQSLRGLNTSALSVGALRLAALPKTAVVAVWNSDLLSGKGYEGWGFCRLTGESGILSAPDFKNEIFERFLTVTDLRLKGLILDQRWVHRNLGDDFHTCISGRGDKAWRYSLAYTDRALDLPGGKIPVVLAIGPVGGAVGDSVPLLLKQDRKKLGGFVTELTEMLATLHTRPALETTLLSALRSEFQPATQIVIDYSSGLPSVPKLPETDGGDSNLTYEQWIAPTSQLSQEQRVILESDVILKSPVRIIGPAGSGKTLLMQLLAIRRLHDFKRWGKGCKIAYIVHNAAMMQMVKDRFTELGCTYFVTAEQRPQILEVVTLSEYSTKTLSGDIVPVMDPDAYETKRFQTELVTSYLKDAVKDGIFEEEKHPLLFQVSKTPEAVDILAELLVTEFGVAIKGHDLSQDKQGYVLSESSLSRLHAILNIDERSVVFDVFAQYQTCLAHELGMLDADDLAITVLGKVSTPLWRLRRKTEGFDFVFVDEAQLFNENERRLFPLLTKGTAPHVPIALALDDAQAINPGFGAGFGALGFGDLFNESLNKVFRSTPAILRLAFHVIQKSTDLFDAAFPNFTSSTVSLIPEDHHLARRPVILTGGQAKSPGKFVERIAARLRASNIRQVCIIVFSERYWTDVVAALRGSKHPWIELKRRGDRIDAKGPLLVVSKPEFVGGQEFDAVICVGLEEGVVPPNVGSNHALAASFEQRAMREIYVAFTRARYRLVVANSVNSNICPLLKDAVGLHIDEAKASEWLN